MSASAGRKAVPLYLLLFPVAIVSFVGALASDIAYAASAFLMWLNDAEWLIAIGLAFGAVAAIVLLVAFVRRPSIRRGPFGWLHLAVFVVALLVELFNAFVHTSDGWTAVVPGGITLSAIGALCGLIAVALLFRMPAARVLNPEPIR